MSTISATLPDNPAVEPSGPAPADTQNEKWQDRAMREQYEAEARKQHHPINPRAGQGKAATKPDLYVPRHTLREIERRVAARGPETWLVESWLPAESLTVVAGKSHAGKSPWAYHMALCIAMGIPFLGQSTKQGRVVIGDFENGERRLLALIRDLCRFLKLPDIPDGIEIIQQRPASDLRAWFNSALAGQPDLLIIDSLKSFYPRALKPDDAGDFMNTVRDAIHEHRSSLMLLHHKRKQSQNFFQGNEEALLEDSVEEISGSLSIVNQSDVRIIFWKEPKPDDKNGAEVVMRGFCRVEDEFGPVYLSREREVIDGKVRVLGYRRITQSALMPSDIKPLYDALPDSFTATEGERAARAIGVSRATYYRKLGQLTDLKYVMALDGKYRKAQNLDTCETSGLSRLESSQGKSQGP